MAKLIQQKELKHSVIVAKGRETRPSITKDNIDECPFCIANKVKIAKSHLEDKEYGIRIVANKYPVCSTQEELFGIHDVVIDTLKHHENPADFTTAHWYALFSLIQKRCRDITKEERIQSIQVFKNFGERAGASIAHSHWQIIALEKVPYSQEGVASDKIAQLLIEKTKQYIVLENDEWQVGIPEVPLMKEEIWLAPKVQTINYEALEESQLKALADIFSTFIKAYNIYKPDAHYNICFSGSRKDGKSIFYIRFIPRQEGIAGYEIATNCLILTKSARTYQEEFRQCLEYQNIQQ